jgi:hypothetical protein
MADDGLHSMEFRIQGDIGSRHDKQVKVQHRAFDQVNIQMTRAVEP